MIPNFLYDKLLKQYGPELTERVLKGYSCKRHVTLRVNTLKSNTDEIKAIFNSLNIKYKEVPWSKEALILEQINETEVRKLSIYEEGKIYLQSLSSMLPAIILEPREDENILDMTAAPGGKTTQMASISGNKALITACEKNRIRAERLKYNIEKQGANRVNVLIEDARNLDNYFSFDKILLDAPCSGSGTLDIENEKLERIFTEELINRSVKTQYELLKKAISILKAGYEMVYSTCSILEEENEKNIEKILTNQNVEVVPINEEFFEGATLLPSKIKGTIVVEPNELYEGFFIAKLRKK